MIQFTDAAFPYPLEKYAAKNHTRMRMEKEERSKKMKEEKRQRMLEMEAQQEWESRREEREAEAKRKQLAKAERERRAAEGPRPLPSDTRPQAQPGRKQRTDRAARRDDEAERDHADWIHPDARQDRKDQNVQKQQTRAAEASEQRARMRKKTLRDAEIDKGKMEAQRNAHKPPELQLAAFVDPKPRHRLTTLADWSPHSSSQRRGAGPSGTSTADDDACSVFSIATTAIELPAPSDHAIQRARERDIDRREVQWTLKRGQVEAAGHGRDGAARLVHRGRRGGADLVTDADGKVAITTFPSRT